MKVILLQNIKGIGQKYEIKNVGDGYAVNFLLPHKKALQATPNEIAKLEKIKATDLSMKAVDDAVAKKIIGELSTKSVTIKAKASDKGHLFDSLSADEIVQNLSKEGINIDAKWLNLDRPIKSIGEHKIPVTYGEAKGVLSLFIESIK